MVALEVRNKRSFENHDFHQPQACTFIVIRVAEIVKAFEEPFKLGKQTVNTQCSKTLILWRTPAKGRVKLNIDGALKGNPRPIGGGGVIGDHYSNWTRGFASNLGFDILSLTHYDLLGTPRYRPTRLGPLAKRKASARIGGMWRDEARNWNPLVCNPSSIRKSLQLESYNKEKAGKTVLIIKGH
ncbi:hypothetical protein Cgig2_033903 [Carnegiea gigantea]|uniref:Uncharacterized protein n=1 Tax=Carnegiea gigantea TaxID=171969 RepID=A0A9Q1GLB5_9CARY|nr:hypothetical protein Cgig2_033903 [Carnegiea gigantea]